MSDEWDSDCETALENLCTEIANGDEARALLAMLPAVRASLAAAFNAQDMKTSCDIEAGVVAKNIATLHSALMEQPDATRAAVDSTIMKMLDEIANRTWERIEWLGGHYCPDRDQMWIDRKMPAWQGCNCDIRKRTQQ